MTLGQELAYVALVTRDVEAAATVFERHLGLRRTDVETGTGKTPVFSVGASALAVFPIGHPYVDGEDKPGVHHIALAVTDLDSSVQAASKAGVPPANGKSIAGLGDSKRIQLDLNATASVNTWLMTPLDLNRSPSLIIERIDHLGIASADNSRAIRAWSGQIGCPLESQQTDMEVLIPVESFTSDKYGVVYHSRPPEPVGGLRVTFIRVGDCELEFLQNFDPSHGVRVDPSRAGTTRQDQGAITKYIASRGAGLHHVALKTPDIDGTLAALDKAGIPLIDRRGRPGSRRALIGFVHPKAFGGVLVHFAQRD